MVRRTAMLGVLACAVLALAGCITAQPKPDGSIQYGLAIFPPPSLTTTTSGGSSSGAGSAAAGSGSAANKPISTKGAPVPVGVPQGSGPWRINVERVTDASSLADGSKAAGGKHFLELDVTVQNTGSSAGLEVHANQFELLDSRHKPVAMYQTSLAAFNAQQVGRIEPGMGGATTFVYEVAPTTGYLFVATPGKGGSGTMTWAVP